MPVRSCARRKELVGESTTWWKRSRHTSGRHRRRERDDAGGHLVEVGVPAAQALVDGLGLIGEAGLGGARQLPVGGDVHGQAAEPAARRAMPEQRMWSMMSAGLEPTTSAAGSVE
ncbi:hypothetical protein ADK97_02645 [Streptomyces sp. H021]|nr:hypothetical protein ADK97_02645 [Streptomyces sp. H021]